MLASEAEDLKAGGRVGRIPNKQLAAHNNQVAYLRAHVESRVLTTSRPECQRGRVGEARWEDKGEWERSMQGVHLIGRIPSMSE